MIIGSFLITIGLVVTAFSNNIFMVLVFFSLVAGICFPLSNIICAYYNSLMIYFWMSFNWDFLFSTSINILIDCSVVYLNLHVVTLTGRTPSTQVRRS